jgi:4-amino-4-deoxy-L-arabinose transferase-like glycosyltransferase
MSKEFNTAAWLRLILLAGLLVRAGLMACAWGHGDRLETPDSAGYKQVSDNLLAGKGFSIDDRPEIFRTPGYPLFVAIGAPFGQDWAYWVAGAQVLVDLGLICLTFLLGRSLCDGRTGLFAAAMLAVSPLAASAAVRILSDSLFAFLLLLAIFLLAKFTDRMAARILNSRIRGAMAPGSWWMLIAASLVTVAACYVRPVGLGFVAIATLVLLARRWKAAVAFVLIVAAGLLPWVIRNGEAADYWGFTSFSSVNAFKYSAPAVLQDTSGKSFDQGRAEMEARLREALPAGASPGKEAAVRLEISKQVVSREPLRYARIHLKNDLAVWMPAATDIFEIAGLSVGSRGTIEKIRTLGPVGAIKAYFGGQMWLLWVAAPVALITLGQYLLAICGAVRCIRLRMPAIYWLMILCVIFFALSPGPAAHPRFREPIEPLICLAAGAGLASLLRRKEAGRELHELRE